MERKTQQDLLRDLPQVEEVLQSPEIKALKDIAPRVLIVSCVRAAIEEARQGILGGKIEVIDIDQIILTARDKVQGLKSRSLRRVINASGVILHTNLGRSILSEEATEAVVDVARNYSTLEYDTTTRERGSRHDHCEQLICLLTGAEAAIAVNNNAAAVMMVLSEFAEGQEVIVSRGELVEIGGSFRVPEIMSLSRAKTVEIGTTNKTHIEDYEGAITADTAMLLKVHPSNYRLVGFTESVGIKQLKRIAEEENKQRGQSSDAEVIVYEDQGSGALLKLECFGEYAEPTVAESLREGCDLVSFSGDKLLGGPQAGIIVGKKKLIDRLKKSPLARALRLDKMTLAALEATLRLYLDEENVLKSIPALNMLSMPVEQVKIKAEDLKDVLEKAISVNYAELSVVLEVSCAGGGALPMCDIDTYTVCVTFKQGSAQACEDYLVKKRAVPIIARVKKESLLLDARTLLNKNEYEEIASALAAYFEQATT